MARLSFLRISSNHQQILMGSSVATSPCRGQRLSPQHNLSLSLKTNRARRARCHRDSIAVACWFWMILGRVRWMPDVILPQLTGGVGGFHRDTTAVRALPSIVTTTLKGVVKQSWQSRGIGGVKQTT